MKITIKEDLRNLVKDTVYDFSLLEKLKILTIVGDNGCGKSTLLQALRGYKNDAETTSLYESDFKKLKNKIEVEHNYEKIFYFDAVKDNGDNFMVAYDAINYLQSGGFQTKNLSHGQGSLYYINKFLHEHIEKIVKDKTLLVFDEIDNGLSTKNLALFSNIIYNIVSKFKCDILIVSHNPFFIKQNHICYDFANRLIIPANRYIERETGFTLNYKIDKETIEKELDKES